MAEFKTVSATPELIRVRVLSNSDIAALANSFKGKGKPAVKPAYKPEPLAGTLSVEEKQTVTPEPVNTIPAEVVEPVVEEETQVIEEPAVVEPEPTVEEPEVAEEVETEVEESVEATTETDISVLGLSATNEKNLRINNLTTVEALEAFVNENELESLPKIGVKAQEAILEALIKWQDEQK